MNAYLIRHTSRASEGFFHRALSCHRTLSRWMRGFIPLVASVLGVLVGGLSALGQTAPVQLITPNSPSALNFVGHSYATGVIKAMSGSDAYGNAFPFSQGWEMTITGNPSPINVVNLGVGNASTVSQGDLIVVTFYSRRIDTATSEANFQVRVQEGSSYTPALDVPIRGRTMWRKQSIPFTALMDATAGNLALIFELGTQAQTLDIAGVTLVDYGQCSLWGSRNIDANAGNTFALYGVNSSNPSYGTHTQVASGLPGYTNCDQFSVTTLPAAGWYVRMDGTVPGAVTAGDYLVAIMWTRETSLPSGTNFGAGAIGFLGTNGAANEYGNGNLMSNSAWKEWIMPFRASASHPANSLVCQIQAGNLVQTLQIAGVQLLDLSKTQMDSTTADNLTGTLYDYPGRDMSDSWHAQADARIATNRQGPINFTVTDGNGNAVAGTTVTANLKRNAFNFGVQTSTYPIAQTNNTGFENALLTLGNSSEIGSYKWGWWDDPTNATQQREWMYQTMMWLRSHGITSIRAHNLLWPSYSASPGTAAGQSASTLQGIMTAHITDEAACTTAGTVVKSYLPIWDFVNEPWDHEDIENGIAGTPVFPETTGPTETNGQCITYADRDAGAAYMQTWTNCMHSAATGDPFPKLVINDWGLIDGEPEVYPSGVDPHRDYDLELMKKLGTNVDGVGFESHCDEFVMPPLNVKQVLDNYVAANSVIKEEVTEYDQVIPSVGQANLIYGLGKNGNGDVPSDVSTEPIYGTLQADWLSDYMTMMYSEPNTDFFDLWTLFDPSTTDHSGMIYTSTGSPKLTFETWDSLTSVTHGRWTTINASATSTANPVAISNCYLGRYELTAKGAITKNFFVDLPTTAGVSVNLQNTGTTNTNVWIYEAERAANAIYAPMVVASDTAGASGGSYAWVPPGTPNNNPTAAELRIDTEATGSVYIWVRTIAPDGNHDSFWMNVDGGSWQIYYLTDSTTWNWSRFSSSPTTLSANTDFPGYNGHTLYFAHRETGAKLDQVLITDDPSFVPH
jgi:hypothetical protein